MEFEKQLNRIKRASQSGLSRSRERIMLYKSLRVKLDSIVAPEDQDLNVDDSIWMKCPFKPRFKMPGICAIF